MTSTGPVVRARLVYFVLEQVRKLPEPSRRAVLELVEPGHLAAVEASASSDWLPFMHHLELIHAIGRALPPEEQHRFFQQQQLESFRSPLFRALVESATTLFGLDAGSWARWIPRAWSLVSRDCGSWEIERVEERLVRATLIAPPPGSLDDAVWLRYVASGLSAILVIARCEGEFALLRVDRERQAALYQMRWTPRE